MAVTSIILSYPIFTPGVLAIIGLFIICLYCLKWRYRSGLRSIPGPFLASITNLYRFFDAWSWKCQDNQLALHEKYGKFVRYGPNLVSISDPEAIQVIYTINKGFVKSPLYKVFFVLSNGKTIQSMFDTQDELYHQSMRKPISHAFAMSHLMDYEPYVDSTSKFFTSRLTELYANTGDICDLGEWLQYYAFDVIGELTYSKRLGFLDRAKDVDGIMRSIDKSFDYAGVVGQMPWLDTLLEKNPIWNYFNPPTSAVAAFTLDCMAERMVEPDLKKPEQQREMEKGNLRKQDMLARMIEAHKADPEKVTPAHILGWASSNTYAGSDTTAISLRALFYHLLKNPGSMEKLLSEISSFEGLSNPVSWTEARKMPYLEACIKEALRIHPAPSMLLERVVPKGGKDICGRFFGEGTIVGINPWVVQRDKDVYGADAELWRPERWLEAGEISRKRMDRTAFAFGGGSRACIGKNISYLEMYKVIPQLLRTFHIELAYPEKEWTLHNNWIHKQSGLLVKLTQKGF
ncbi:uncharacterized protein LAJ45_00670 [Morchella importuna]|uniref:uncharacterized protein n=1 Tax=Morchella importuna TaxID=1174673 RepID=UPI001E8E0EE1|nr:uncharacterized protein LAJ45_00670 [Morchella importuna]KAH8155660.1 hypothetical protein LAJ45_00670 [Morchella importuna]